MDIGANIKKLRIKKGLTQKELAEIIKVTAVTIQNYENNRRTPDFVVLDELADALNCKLFDLLGAEHPTMREDIDYFKEYLKSLGYEINGDLISEGYLFLETKEGTYEIELKDLEELQTSSRSFIEYKLHEIVNKSRKIKK